MDAAGHAEVAIARAARVVDLLTDNSDLLARYGIDANRAIARIDRAARAGDPAYVALEPILILGGRIGRIGDRINGTVVRGRTITVRSGPDDNLDGDELCAIAINLVDSIPRGVELYFTPSRKILRSV